MEVRDTVSLFLAPNCKLLNWELCTGNVRWSKFHWETNCMTHVTNNYMFVSSSKSRETEKQKRHANKRPRLPAGSNCIEWTLSFVLFFLFYRKSCCCWRHIDFSLIVITQQYWWVQTCFELRWPNVIERCTPGSSPGRGHFDLSVLGQDTLLSQFRSPPGSVNGYRRQNAGGNMALE